MWIFAALLAVALLAGPLLLLPLGMHFWETGMDSPYRGERWIRCCVSIIVFSMWPLLVLVTVIPGVFIGIPGILLLLRQAF
ncbi:MAG: hypothetical protein CTY20_14800 [Hyphomicrobium sp.]|nr:MAG: hypothetical protein CTY20_14800 [Hyphomicrobium sp.]